MHPSIRHYAIRIDRDNAIERARLRAMSASRRAAARATSRRSAPASARRSPDRSRGPPPGQRRRGVAVSCESLLGMPALGPPPGLGSRSDRSCWRNAGGADPRLPRRDPRISKRSKRSATVTGSRAFTAHAVGGLRALEVSGDLVELGQAAALGEGQQQVDAPQRLAELLLDPLAQRVEALARDGGDEHRLGMAEAELLAALGVHRVRLVEDEQPRALARADLLEHLVDGPDHLLHLLLRRDASTTCRIRSDMRVSSSVAPNASTSWWGSLRMKPTVSVSRYGRSWSRGGAGSDRACGTAGRGR